MEREADGLSSPLAPHADALADADADADANADADGEGEHARPRIDMGAHEHISDGALTTQTVDSSSAVDAVFTPTLKRIAPSAAAADAAAAERGDGDDTGSTSIVPPLTPYIPEAQPVDSTPATTPVVEGSGVSSSTDSHDGPEAHGYRAGGTAAACESAAAPVSRAAAQAPVPPPSPWNPPPPYHPDSDTNPPVFLLMVTTGASSDSAIEAVAARKGEIVRSLVESGAMATITSTVTAAGHMNNCDFAASSYGIPGLVHFIYMWKPTRQFASTLWPWPASLPSFHYRRKALLRAYCRVYENLTASTPVLRHSVSAWEGGGFDLEPEHAPVASSMSSVRPASRVQPVPLLQAIGGCNTTNAIVLASFDASVGTDRIPGLLEKLAKTVRKDHDRLLMAAPVML